MANRFPLIVDAANVASSIIKELPVGDTLDFNSSGIANLAVANLQLLGGTSGQFLQTDGSGNLSWTTISSGGSAPTGEYGIYKTNPSTTIFGNVSGGTGRGVSGDNGGGGGGSIGGGAGGVGADENAGGNGAQSIDVSGLQAAVTALGLSWTTFGAGSPPGNASTGNINNGGNATGFGCGGGGAGYYGGNGGAGLYGGGGGGGSGWTAIQTGGTGGNGAIVINYVGAATPYVLIATGANATSPIPSGTTSMKVWAIGGGGGGAGCAAIDGTSGGGGSAGGVAFGTISNPVVGQSVQYSIGTPGAGGVGANNGSNGGSTTFSYSTYSLTANGGVGGGYNNGVTVSGGNATASGFVPEYLASGSANTSSTTYANLAALQVTSVTVSSGASSASSYTWYTTFYANGVYLKAVQNTTDILSSTDGTTWTTRTGAITNRNDSQTNDIVGQKFAWNGNVYMAISRDTNSPATNAQCQTSPDGITWTQRTNPGLSTTANQYTIISHGTRFICYIHTPGTIKYSDDEGVTWSTGGGLPFSITSFSIGTNGTRLVAISSTGTQSAYSDNGGVSWTLNSASVGGTSAPCRPVWNGTYWLLVYNAAGNQTLSWSFDGLTWISSVGVVSAARLGWRVPPVWTGKFWVTYGYVDSSSTWMYRIFRHPWEAVLLQTNIPAANVESGLASDGTGYTYVAFGTTNTNGSVQTAKYTIALPATFTVATPTALGSNTGTWYVKT